MAGNPALTITQQGITIPIVNPATNQRVTYFSILTSVEENRQITEDNQVGFPGNTLTQQVIAVIPTSAEVTDFTVTFPTDTSDVEQMLRNAYFVKEPSITVDDWRLGVVATDKISDSDLIGLTETQVTATLMGGAVNGIDVPFKMVSIAPTADNECQVEGTAGELVFNAGAHEGKSVNYFVPIAESDIWSIGRSTVASFNQCRLSFIAAGGTGAYRHTVHTGHILREFTKSTAAELPSYEKIIRAQANPAYGDPVLTDFVPLDEVLPA